MFVMNEESIIKMPYLNDPMLVSTSKPKIKCGRIKNNNPQGVVSVKDGKKNRQRMEMSNPILLIESEKKLNKNGETK